MCINCGNPLRQKSKFAIMNVDPLDRKAHLDSEMDKPSDKAIVRIVNSTTAEIVRHDDDFTRARNIPYVNPATNDCRTLRILSGLHGNVSLNRAKADNTEVNVQLPGHGKVSNPGNCGVSKGAYADANGHVLKNRLFLCNTPTCPYCWEAWTHKTARKTMQWIRGGRELFALYGSNYQLCHITITAPKEYTFMLNTKYGYDKAMINFSRLASLYGISGFMVCHPWRGKKDSETDISLEISPEDLNDPEYWKEGLHVHITGFADPDVIKSTSGLFYSATGYIIKVIDNDLDDEYAENCIAYALTHCGIGVIDDPEDSVSDDGDDPEDPSFDDLDDPDDEIIVKKKKKSRHNLKAIRPIGYMQTSKNQKSIAKLREFDEKVTPICEKCELKLYDMKEFEFANQFPDDCDDGDRPEDYMEPIRVTLHHVAFCRRDELEGWRILTESMTDAQFTTYAFRSSDGGIAIAFDTRKTIIPPNFNMSDDPIGVRPDDKDDNPDPPEPEPWRPPETGFSGQSLLSPPDPPKFKPRMTFAYADDDSIGWGSDDDI